MDTSMRSLFISSAAEEAHFAPQGVKNLRQGYSHARKGSALAKRCLCLQSADAIHSTEGAGLKPPSNGQL